MSDSFADLWNTSAPLPAKPKPQTQTLGARLAEENSKRYRAAATKTTNTAVGVQPHKASDVFHEAWAGLDSLEGGMNVKVDSVDDDKSSNLLNLLDDDDDDHDYLIDGINDHGHGIMQGKGGFDSDHDLMGGGTTAGQDEDEDILGMLSKPVEVVIANKSAAQSRPTPRPTAPTPSPPPSTPPPNVRGPPKGQKERERERRERESRNRREDYSRAGPATTDIQDQADKLLLQASEIGLSVLNRASAFWKEGKEKVVKVIEERSGGSGGGGGYEERERRRRNVDGRRNMDLFPSELIPTLPQQRPSQPPTRTHSQTQSRTHSRTQSRTHSPRPQPQPQPRRQRTLLTASSSTLSLASSHKNTGTSQFKLGQYGFASESYTSAINLLPPRHLLLVPLYTNRSLARLKCGEYVGAGEDAAEALNIICVVDSTIDSNANAKLSNGNGNGNVIWNPDTELPELIQGGRDKVNQGGWSDPRGVGVDLVDGYVKALRRRAEAWEGREKWVEAGRDWEVLAGGGGGVGQGWIGEGIRTEAVRGAGRCRQMVSDGLEGVGFSSSSSSSASKPPPKPKTKTEPFPSRAPSSQPSKALLAHQATTLQAEADDTLKHQLKDSVDARISAWKNGKETNIRALLASLDMVLWQEILSGGVKVNGLGELVMDSQVKKGYMKAIARVHPDKFNTLNSTVEQRMLANSVFATLNEAWIAFQGGK